MEENSHVVTDYDGNIYSSTASYNDNIYVFLYNNDTKL